MCSVQWWHSERALRLPRLPRVRDTPLRNWQRAVSDALAGWEYRRVCTSTAGASIICSAWADASAGYARERFESPLPLSQECRLKASRIAHRTAADGLHRERSTEYELHGRRQRRNPQRLRSAPVMPEA